MTATEVARQFSAIVNRVGAGEEIEVTRNGAPVMQMRPARRRQTLSAAEWRDLMASAPGVDDGFARDVEEARRAARRPGRPMAVLIDTSVLIDVERRGTTLDDAISEQGRAISVITMSELLHGVHRAAEDKVRVHREAFVERLLAAVEPLPVTASIARVHSRIWAGLASAGERISPHDMWIAATALSHGMGVATANARDFGRVPGLLVYPIGAVAR